MRTVSVLVTDVGEFPAPKYMRETFASCKIRKDGQPDKRAKSSRLWYHQFNEFCRRREEEYMTLASQSPA